MHILPLVARSLKSHLMSRFLSICSSLCYQSVEDTGSLVTILWACISFSINNLALGKSVVDCYIIR